MSPLLSLVPTSQRRPGIAWDAPAGTARDAGELLDVDMDDLTRTPTLIAHCRLETEAAEPAEADPGQYPG